MVVTGFFAQCMKLDNYRIARCNHTNISIAKIRTEKLQITSITNIHKCKISK